MYVTSEVQLGIITGQLIADFRINGEAWSPEIRKEVEEEMVI